MKGWLCPSLRRSGSISARVREVSKTNGNFSPVELGQGFFRSGKGIRARIDQSAFQGSKDQMTRGKQGSIAV